MNVIRRLMYLDKDYNLSDNFPKDFINTLQVDIDKSFGHGGHYFKSFNDTPIIKGIPVVSLSFYLCNTEVLLTTIIAQKKDGSLTDITNAISLEKRRLICPDRYSQYSVGEIHGSVIKLFMEICKELKAKYNING